ncbi:MAG: hypothetical protein ACC657_13440 [Thiohalomonadales bacterium]
MAQAKKKIVKGEALVTAVDSALSVLINIASNTAKSIAIVDKENKKFTQEVKRFSKKKAILMKKKKNAASKVKKSPIVANKRVLKAVVKEIATVTKEAAKNAALKTAALEELTILKSVARRTTAYNRSLAAADRILNKPSPKKKKRAKKPTVTASELSIVGNIAAA